jgi:hypothetical protein
MKTYNNHALCKEAEFYYYDFLSDQSHKLIPKDIIQHINQCPCCREKINQLNIGLSSYSSKQSQKSLDISIITDLLTLHLAYIDNKVDCQTVKPFLPVFLDPDFRIKIPTPISVHLDHCHQCAQDLETIENLNLSLIQSCRLSQLLADKKAKNKTLCSKARTAIPAITSLNFQQTNAQVLKHICACPDCREALYQHRQKVLTECLHDKEQQKCSTCNRLSTSDIFDYVMMYGLDPGDEQNVASGKSLTSHLRDCPTGLAKMQKLHRRIYKIAEGDKSKTITIYHIDEYAKTHHVSESKDQYDGFPIRVEVTHQKDKEDIKRKTPALTFSAALKHKISALHASPALKIGIVAVAAFLVGVTLFFRPSVAGALTIGQLYSAIDQVKNVHISRFTGQPNPIQEKWISRSFNVSILKTSEDWRLINFKTKQEKIKKTTGSVQVTRLSDEIIADFQYQTRGSLGLMPYDQMSGLPSDAEWNEITDKETTESGENTQIYELIWTPQNNYGSSSVYNKWLFTIDSETNLPEKIECYRKLNADSQYTLTSTMVIEYPDDHAMKAVIDSF